MLWVFKDLPEVICKEGNRSVDIVGFDLLGHRRQKAKVREKTNGNQLLQLAIWNILDKPAVCLCCKCINIPSKGQDSMGVSGVCCEDCENEQAIVHRHSSGPKRVKSHQYLFHCNVAMAARPRQATQGHRITFFLFVSQNVLCQEQKTWGSHSE